jgi:hypothetical protein
VAQVIEDPREILVVQIREKVLAVARVDVVIGTQTMRASALPSPLTLADSSSGLKTGGFPLASGPWQSAHWAW